MSKRRNIMNLNTMVMDTRGELAEATSMLESAKGPRVRAALTALVATLEASIESSAAATPAALAEAKEPSEKVIDSGVGSSPSPAPSAVEKTPESNSAGASAPSLNGTTSAGSKTGTAADAAMSAASNAPIPAKMAPSEAAVSRASEVKYEAFDRFAWDQGAYNSPKVSVYVPLEGVGKAKDRVSCSFNAQGFDLRVMDLGGKNFRLVQNNLDKDIEPNQSSFLVKKDKIIVKLQKVKGEYGSYDHWNSLAAKKTRPVNKSDPSAGIMDMMKDMYDEGDDNMKKIIGEAMLKSRNQEKPPEPSFESPSFGNKDFGGDDMDDEFDLGDYGLKRGRKTSPGLSKSLGDEEDGYGFGSAVPPPEENEPIPPTLDDDEIGVDGDDDIMVDGGAANGKETGLSAGETPAPAAGSGMESKTNTLEALDD